MKKIKFKLEQSYELSEVLMEIRTVGSKAHEYEEGYENMGDWIEKAAKDACR